MKANPPADNGRAWYDIPLNAPVVFVGKLELQELWANTPPEERFSDPHLIQIYGHNMFRWSDRRWVVYASN